MSDPLGADCCPDGVPHVWMCMTMQVGEIIGVDYTGAPIFIPVDTAAQETDTSSPPTSVYGCVNCSTVWDESLTTT